MSTHIFASIQARRSRAAYPSVAASGSTSQGRSPFSTAAPIRALLRLCSVLLAVLFCFTAASAAYAQMLPPPGGGITVTINPTSIFQNQTCTITVTLSSPAPTGGATVSMTSSDTSKMTVPASILIPANQTTGTCTGSGVPTNNTAGYVTVSASYNGSSGSAQETINVLRQLPSVTGLKCSDLSLKKAIWIKYNFAPPNPDVIRHFEITRLAVTPYDLTNCDPDGQGPQDSSTTFTTTSTTFEDDFAWDEGKWYYYSVKVVPNDPNNLTGPPGYRYTASNTVTIMVVPGKFTAQDNQTVDSRLDLRYSENHLLNFNFGNKIYRGGLYAGNSTDPSRVGRSYIRVLVPSNQEFTPHSHFSFLPQQVGFWCTSADLYYTGSPVSHTTTGVSAGAKLVTDNAWTVNTLVWGNQPTFDPTTITNPVSIFYDKAHPENYRGWTHFPLVDSAGNPIPLQDSQTIGIGVTTEATDPNALINSWLYFAKKEYGDGTMAPCELCAWYAPPLYTLTLSSYTIQGGTSLTGTITLIGPSLNRDMTITLFTSSNLVQVPAFVTLPSGQTSVTFPITTSPVGMNKHVGIVYAYRSEEVLTLTP